MTRQTPAKPTTGELPKPPAKKLGTNLASFKAFAADIKIAHSVFALPFAMSAFVIGHLPLPTVRQVLLLLTCMVCARSFAMGMNRFLDRRIDRANPRTLSRKIPAGQLTARQGFAWSALAGALLIAAAFALSPLAGYCAPPLLAILATYSLMKHLTWLTHWYLGFCLGLAPVAVTVAMTGTAPISVLFVGLGVCLWTAGFDVLYALQDREFDVQHGLHSVPRHFGPVVTLRVSRICFAVMIAALAMAGHLAAMGPYYYAGIALMTALLIYEHVLVRDARIDGRSRHLNVAFFNMNAYVSVVYFVFTALDAYLW